MERFDLYCAQLNGTSATAHSINAIDSKPSSDGNSKLSAPASSTTPREPKREVQSEEISDFVDGAPPKKKRKPSLDEDAIYAARLQAEEDKMARPTRGGSNRKSALAKKKKSPKKKAAARIKAEDDSEVDDSETSEKKPIKNTGFHVRQLFSISWSDTDSGQKPLILSAPLSDLFHGETMACLPEVCAL